MKKFFISVSLAASFCISAIAGTATVSVNPGGFALLCAGPIKVSQLIVTGTTATNATAIIVDTATNSMTYSLGAYTNTISYLTNLPSIYTNYWGVLNTNANSGGTNMVQVDVANSVAISTPSCPTVAVASTASASITLVNLNQYFFRGAWVTNTGSGVVSITATYVSQ